MSDSEKGIGILSGGGVCLYYTFWPYQVTAMPAVIRLSILLTLHWVTRSSFKATQAYLFFFLDAVLPHTTRPSAFGRVARPNRRS